MQVREFGMGSSEKATLAPAWLKPQPESVTPWARALTGTALSASQSGPAPNEKRPSLPTGYDRSLAGL